MLTPEELVKTLRIKGINSRVASNIFVQIKYDGFITNISLRKDLSGKKRWVSTIDNVDQLLKEIQDD